MTEEDQVLEEEEEELSEFGISKEDIIPNMIIGVVSLILGIILIILFVCLHKTIYKCLP